MVARATGTTIDFELLDRPQHRDDRCEDHQQPPGPRGCLADERGHRPIGDGIYRGVRWHAGSVTAGRSVASNLANRPRRARLRDNIRATCAATLRGVSQDAPASDARSQERPTRSKYWWLRWVIIGVAAIVLAVELTLVWDQLAKAWKSVYSANWWWVLAAIIAAMSSMHSFAQIQRTLLRSAGVKVKQWRSEAAFYAGNALSTTLPGGPVLSATFIYRQQRIWGASPVVASWQLVMSGALQVVGLAVLGLGGAFMLGASKNPLSLIFSLGGFVALILLAQAVATRPELIDGIGVRVLSWYNSLRGKPADTGLNKWRETLSQLESVSLSRRELGEAFGWSLFNWIADVGCLLFACYATGGHPSLAGVTVAYAAARAVGSIPLMPGIGGELQGGGAAHDRIGGVDRHVGDALERPGGGARAAQRPGFGARRGEARRDRRDVAEGFVADLFGRLEREPGRGRAGCRARAAPSTPVALRRAA